MTPDTSTPGAVEQWMEIESGIAEYVSGSRFDRILDYCAKHDASDRTLRDLLRQCLSAMVNAALHVEELRDAWERGALSEHDGKGGTRSNRNMDIVLELKAAIPAAQKALEETP